MNSEMQLPQEVRDKVLELVDLESRIREFDDDKEGPWYYPDGRRFDRGSQLSGPPPANHPRRCHAPSTRTRRRCGRWAIRGRDYCEFHGGRNPLRAVQRWSKMPRAYSKVLMPSLQERLQEFLHSETRAEQLELYEEIALARTFLTEQVQLCSAVMSEPKMSLEARLGAMNIVRQATDHVADLCGKMARIEKDLTDAVSVHNLGVFVDEVARVIHGVLGDDPRVAQISEQLKTRARLPAPSESGNGQIRTGGTVKIEYD